MREALGGRRGQSFLSVQGIEAISKTANLPGRCHVRFPQFGLVASLRHAMNPRLNLTIPLVGGFFYIAPRADLL